MPFLLPKLCNIVPLRGHDMPLPLFKLYNIVPVRPFKLCDIVSLRGHDTATRRLASSAIR